MIKNNKFYINNLKTVVIFGYSNKLKEILTINKKLNLKTLIITDPHQSKFIPKKEIDYSIFKNFNNRCKNFILKNTNINQTIFIVLGARYIFTENSIKTFFKKNIINFHGKRLPYDKGGGGFSWQIMRQDRIDSQLVYLLDSNVDSGPIIENKVSLFPKNCQIPLDFEKYHSTKFIEFYSLILRKISKGKKFDLKYQSKYLGRYNSRLNTEINGWIDWSIDSNEIINFINAFDDPYMGASTFLNNGKFGRLFLKKVHLHGGDGSNHPFMSGLVSRHDGGWLVVSTTSKHMLLIEEVLNINRENIINKIKVGDRFFTPLKKLIDSNKKRIQYNSLGLKK